MTYQAIAEHINEQCITVNCLMCDEADRYSSYKDCPYLALKQIARHKPVTIQDIQKSMLNSEVIKQLKN